MTPLQAGVLRFLHRYASATLTDAATTLGVMAPTLSQVVTDLVGKRWVTKRRSVMDSRAVCLSLSRRGEALAQRIEEQVQRVSAQIKYSIVAKQKESVRTRCLILLVLLVTLSGCVVTYGNFPAASLESLPKDHEPKALSYYVNSIPYALFNASSGGPTDQAASSVVVVLVPNWYPLAMKDFREAGVREVSRTLEASGMFSELIPGEASPSGEGTYVNIEFHNHDPSPGAVSTALHQLNGCGAILLCLLGVWGAIPHYSDEGGLTVDYHLHQNGTPQHTYQYRIYKKGAGGLLLLPFAWLNFFTDDLKDALRATTLQFLIDAQREGNL